MHDSVPLNTHRGARSGDPPIRIWTVADALDSGRCADCISRGSGGAWRRSAVKEGASPTRAIQAIEIDVDFVFDRLRAHLPATIEGLKILRVPRERVLLLRYSPGDKFALHRDAPYVPDERSRSLLSLIIYLNEDYVGGETRFPDDDRLVRPQAGMAVAFPHDVRHEGLAIVSGEKYALHTFVIYQSGEQ